MKVYKDETHTHSVLDHEICDMCGNIIECRWDEIIESIRVSYEKEYSAWGDHWYEPESWFVDLCPECMNKVKQFLIDNGTKIQDYL